jgi:hypothetical protein
LTNFSKFGLEKESFNSIIEFLYYSYLSKDIGGLLYKKNRIPRAKESVFKEYKLFLSVSGGIKSGLPTLNIYFTTVSLD